ncbi:hypothetical protein LQR31_11985 [Chromobacterium vaccinii]|uniref:Uncharacterized protein n=1 Tax=Chromobacterium vaccinii TaxID=1108595 RepID=A0A1D9LMM5_9NEIS|nr:hypothetical protein [Chromobacterium vaccinii]AOZ52580.1 hypothetical protein BKX93_22910 [Chromobacterium vaccinii]MCD4485197.1 hypothetical protein [Chromobacterium vaccinii]
MYDDGRVFLVAGYWAKLKKAFSAASVYVIADTATVASSLAKRCMPQFQPAGVMSLAEVRRYVNYMNRIAVGDEACLTQEGVAFGDDRHLPAERVFVVVGFSKTHAPDRNPVVNFVVARSDAEAAVLQQGAMPSLSVSGVVDLARLTELLYRMERVATGEVPALKEHGVIR